MALIDQLKETVNEVVSNYEAFTAKGNKAAGTRARKGLQDLKKISQELRTEIQESKNSAK